MCGRFVMRIDKKELADIIKEVERNVARPEDLMTLKVEGEIFPTDVVPVKAADGFKPMSWGFQIPKKTIINARSETVMEKPLFRDAMLERRCVIVASGYYEWKLEADGTKTKFEFFPPDQEPLFLAGCYRRKKDRSIPSFVILTRDAAQELAQFHDRMPVILTTEQADRWLGDDDLDIAGVIRDSVTALAHTRA